MIIPWNRFAEESALESREIADFRGEQIELPKKEGFTPSLEGLKWHIKEVEYIWLNISDQHV